MIEQRANTAANTSSFSAAEKSAAMMKTNAATAAHDTRVSTQTALTDSSDSIVMFAPVSSSMTFRSNSMSTVHTV